MARSPRRRSAGNETISDPNMTPLIDVSLVLVVILMVATPMAFQSSLHVNRASESGRKTLEKVRTERIELAVRTDGTVTINRHVVARPRMAETLRPLIERSATRMVVVRCEGGVLHGAFVSVLDEAKGLGAAQIAVVGG